MAIACQFSIDHTAHGAATTQALIVENVTARGWRAIRLSAPDQVYFYSSFLHFDSVPLRRFPPYMMPLPARGLAVRVFHVSVALVLAGSLLYLSSPAVILDREEWAKPSAVPLSNVKQLGSNHVLTEGCLRRLVHECSRRIDLEGLGCEERAGAHDDFRVPYAHDQPHCGFEVGLATMFRTCQRNFASNPTGMRKHDRHLKYGERVQ